MKNLIQLQTQQTCIICDQSGYFVSSGDGGDYVYCPCCNRSIDIDDYEEVVGRTGFFCEDCGIIFDYGCLHAENGCTDSIYNGHLPGVWKDRQSGFTYHGCPQFESLEEFKLRMCDIEILKWVCPNGGIRCRKISKSKFPEYYSEGCDIAQ